MTELGRADADVPRAASRTGPWVPVVVALGLVARAVLVPLTHGQDFVVWDLASRATLRGVDVYAHHPRYPGGPYTYFPLFLYLELPFRWLALHTGVPFTVLGKLPIVAGDVAAAGLLVRELRDRGVAERRVAAAAAAFFLNPLVLYDGAYEGRFDSVALALLLLSVRRLSARPDRGAISFGLAVAAKTFPVFAVAGFLRAARGRLRFAATAAAVLAVLLAPYLGAPAALWRDIVGYNARKGPQALSWLTLLPGAHAQAVGTACLALFAAGTVLLAVRLPLAEHVLAVLVLFLLLNKVVLEQYLVWPLPFLALLAARPGTGRRLAAAAVAYLALLTAIGMLANPDIHPWGRSAGVLVVLLAAASAAFLALLVGLAGPATGGPAPIRGRTPGELPAEGQPIRSHSGAD